MTLLQSGKTLAISAAVFAMTSGMAMAQDYSRWSYWRDRYDGSRLDRQDTYSSVPEIDAGAGLLALAAVAAAMVLVWELRRRRSKA
jgi:hypothetical protein